MKWGKVGHFGEYTCQVGNKGEVYLNSIIFLETSLKCHPR